MRISVIIPHLNQPDLLALCLASLAAGRRRPDEIIVVDNGSHSLPEAVCQAHPGTQLLHEAQPGPGLARNRGIAAASGDVLAFIDADCIADPAWLEVAQIAMSDPDAAILGGDVRIGCVDPARPTITEAYESIYAYRMDRYIAEQGFTGTGNLVVRKAVLDDVGPFAGIDVAEDRDWGHRATAKGYQIRYVAEMRVFHPARASLSDLCRKWDRQLAHDYAAARNRPGGQARWAVKTLAMLPSVLAELPRILRSARVQGARARLLAFAGLCRIRAHRTARMLHLALSGDPSALAGRWNRD